jgi:signal transduction histidine kinase
VSLRARLLLVSLLTLGAGLGALLVLGDLLVHVGVNAQAMSILRGRAEAQLAALRVEHGTLRVRESPNDEALDRRSWVIQGGRVIERPAGISPGLDRAALALARRRLPAQADGPDDIRLRAVPVLGGRPRRRAGTVVVGYSMAPLERLQKEVLVGSLVFAALILGAGVLVTRRALDGALRPVAQMTARAEDWGAHDLDHRFGLGPPRDELTGLAATLDGLLGRIAASRRHEQRFAGEVAHELRTPLAGLRGRAELALAAHGPDAGAEREGALRAVVDGAERLSRIIDSLLAVARRELDPSSGSVELVALAREVGEVETTGPVPMVEGEAEVVRRALAPLMENAHRHARSRVWLELSAQDGRVRLAVRDDGPGLDPELGERVFDPGVRGDADGEGAGLGLALARRLARSCGGDVTSGPGPGGCFVLELPAA